MLTKLVTAVVGLVVALILLRYFVDRADRARIKAQQRDKAEQAPKVTTLEFDPHTGSYRPKD